MKVLARADANRIATLSTALEASCPTVQQQELIRTSGSAMSRSSTILLAQDTAGLAMLLGGAQGAALAPPLRR